MTTFLNTPFPRPKNNLKNAIKVFVLGALASAFVILFQPFSIENESGIWYYDLLIISMGLVFSGAIYLMEFLIPSLGRNLFNSWNLGKAILWYAWLILFVGAVMFLYKSYLAGFGDFTFKEYLFVIGRITGIGLIVSFFGLGIFSYLNRQKLALVASKESFIIKTSDDKSITLKIDDILYISSDDNYVDIHTSKNGKRDKLILRSSLKNIESQIVNPLSPVYRCHRRYLININYFEIKSDKSRNTSIELKSYKDEIPVSSKYAKSILNLLRTRH